MTDQPSNIIIYNTDDGKASVALYARDGKIWLNQQQMVALGLPLCFAKNFLPPRSSLLAITSLTFSKKASCLKRQLSNDI